MATKRDRLRNKIQKAITDQLKEKNLIKFEHYKDLCEDYMSFWDIKCELIDDIQERGTMVEWDNGGGQCGVKKNESIQELNKTSQHMLKILSELGIRAADLKVADFNGDL